MVRSCTRQVQHGRGLRLFFRQVQHLAGVLEEDVRAGAGLVEVEEAEVQGRRFRDISRHAVCRCQEVAAPLIGEEDCDACHQQRVGQAVDEGIEQRAQVGLRIQAAAEVDQRLPVVIALAVEDAVYAFLDGALQRIEQLRRDHDGRDQAPHTEVARQILVGNLR
jgi:hypothetical protein